MNLEFVKKDNWEAEFEATADFNLHIEGVPEGQVRIYQRGTSDGEYAYVREATPYPSFTDVYDFDFSALMYPKWIKVVCGNKPTSAQIVTDGDVQQMKFQDKTVEIASNGTTLVTPDDGFTALGTVNVKVNVPTSGEGVGYLYFENIPLNAMIEVLAFSSLINNGTQIIPSFLCGFNSQGKEENITVRKIAAMYGYTLNDMKITEDFLREFMSVRGSIVEITEEEFYNLEA